MAGYEYNPLLKLDLQKRSAVSPADIEHIEEEITTINGDLKNKVPKFFTSIEELEIDEIGEFQGKPGGDFVPGYFYKRNEPSNIEYLSETINIQGNTYLELKEQIADEYVLKYRQYYKGVVDLPYETIQVYSNDNELGTIRVLLFSPNFFVGSTLIYDGNHANGYCVFPYAIIGNEASHNSRFDFNNPIRVQNGVFYYKGQALEGHWGGGMIGCPVGISIEEPNVYYIWCYTGYWSFFPILINSTLDKGAFVTDLSLQCIDGWSTPYGSQYNEDIQDYAFTANQPFTRTDTQPSLDPSAFATSEQGEKADTALQSIAKGTDGNYITTTIGAKADNSQTVSSSLTIQALSNAGESAKGLAEASDVKKYIGNNTATPAQGTKADSALQQVEHGTDGQFITTTVTQKANNAQTISTSLTLQDIATADAQHQGVAEASDVKKYFTTYIPYNPIYGIMWDRENPDPDCVRIGNLDLHATLPVHSQIVGGTLTDAGAFSPFADQSDWTGETRDGSVGQVMSRLPKFYYKFITEGTKCKVLFSADEVSGFPVFPMQYISSYKATLQRSTSKLSSVVNLDADYRGGNNNADWDGTYRTLLGKPASNITDFRTYARNRNDGDTQWNAMVYMQRKMLYWLFAVEYATRNTQKAYNAALDSNGCRQGGLGVGVTDWNWDSWNAFNGHYPLIPCGYTDEYGNATAQKQYDLIAADGVSIAYTFQVPRYRGIESPFGDIWEWHDGILVSVQADAAGGKSPVYVTADPSKFSSTDFTQYDYVCDEIRSQNFIKDIHFGDNGDIICTSTPGASTQYYCDWWYGANLPSSGTSLRGVPFGGDAHHGARAGLVCGDSSDAPAHVGAHIGSRLCYIPELT